MGPRIACLTAHIQDGGFMTAPIGMMSALSAVHGQNSCLYSYVIPAWLIYGWLKKIFDLTGREILKSFRNRFEIRKEDKRDNRILG